MSIELWLSKRAKLYRNMVEILKYFEGLSVAFKGLSKYVSKCTANNKSIHAMSHVLHNHIKFPQPQGLITKVVNTMTKFLHSVTVNII